MVTSERTPSDTSYQKYVALVALLYFIHLVNFTMLHYTPDEVNEVFFFSSSSSPTSLQRCCQALKSHQLWSLLRFRSTSPVSLSASLLRVSIPQHFLFAFQLLLDLPVAPRPITRRLLFDSFSFNVHTSIDFFDLPDNLLLEDGQYSVIFAYLFEHHPAVKLIAYLLEIIPEKRAKSFKFSSCDIYSHCAQKAALIYLNVTS